MRTVWKFELSTAPAGYGTIDAQSGRILRVEPYMGVEGATLWIEVDSEAPPTVRPFAIRGTGHPLSESAQHVHTWEDPPFVWHLYEESPQKRCPTCNEAVTAQHTC